MFVVICRIIDAVVCKSSLPNLGFDLQLLAGAERETPFDELHHFLERNFKSRRDKQVQVVRHDYEFVEQQSLLASIIEEHVEQEARHSFRLKNGTMLVGVGRYKECADFLGREHKQCAYTI